jgi:hypothetical protein
MKKINQILTMNRTLTLGTLALSLAAPACEKLTYDRVCMQMENGNGFFHGTIQDTPAPLAPGGQAPEGYWQIPRTYITATIECQNGKVVSRDYVKTDESGKIIDVESHGPWRIE